MPAFLGDVLIGLGLFVGGVLTGAHYALKASSPGRFCTCGHFEDEHVDGACDGSEVCDCREFVRLSGSERN